MRVVVRTHTSDVRNQSARPTQPPTTSWSRHTSVRCGDAASIRRFSTVDMAPERSTQCAAVLTGRDSHFRSVCVCTWWWFTFPRNARIWSDARRRSVSRKRNEDSDSGNDERRTSDHHICGMRLRCDQNFAPSVANDCVSVHMIKPRATVVGHRSPVGGVLNVDDDDDDEYNCNDA